MYRPDLEKYASAPIEFFEKVAESGYVYPSLGLLGGARMAARSTIDLFDKNNKDPYSRVDNALGAATGLGLAGYSAHKLYKNYKANQAKANQAQASQPQPGLAQRIDDGMDMAKTVGDVFTSGLPKAGPVGNI